MRRSAITGLVFGLLAVTLPGRAAAADDGVYVRTLNGFRCWVTDGGNAHVACEYEPGFPQAPVRADGSHYTVVVAYARGALEWRDGGIGGQSSRDDIVVVQGHPTGAFGWRIEPATESTRFTYIATTHGMYLSADEVHLF